MLSALMVPLSSTVASFSLLLDQIISFAKPNASYSICALFFYYTDFFCLKYRPGSCCSLECCSLLTSSLSVISLGGSSWSNDFGSSLRLLEGTSLSKDDET